ncbi:hypothetical protein [Criblamydia sequanensis]|uniref:Uncharacterized protein n=1 Tax=Candidatus Criblamydia sequanensis CRIB-18 TaxID=1437425 RepID=A0A090D0P6_9BACT|nr:hypothetical protein [Criblamydia sequanensis]CDR33430.1 hypothetical protein CSEC_0597 [Criblamydia sequanensis CRIB-18]
MQATANDQAFVSLIIRRVDHKPPLSFQVPADTKVETLRELIESEVGKGNPFIKKNDFRYRFHLNIKSHEESLRDSEVIGSMTDSKTGSVFLNMYPKGPYYPHEAYFEKIDEKEKRAGSQETLLELFKDFSEKIRKSAEFSDEKVIYGFWTSAFFKKIEEDPGILDKLDIEVSPARMREIYKKYGIIALREPENKFLDILLYCGNNPVFSSAMGCTYAEREFEEIDYHRHVGKTTIDIDPLMNPCLIAVWPSRNLLTYLSEFLIISLEGDGMEPISTLLKNEIEMEKGLKFLAEVMFLSGKVASFRFNKPLAVETGEGELTGDFNDPVFYENFKGNPLSKVTWYVKSGDALEYAKKLNEPFIEDLTRKADKLGFDLGISKVELNPFPSLHLSYEFYFIKK